MTKRIAIIGQAFRFPGTDSDHYWVDLLSGRDLVTESAQNRWSHEAFFHPNKLHPGTAYSFAAGSIGNIAGFDASFFGISPREAAVMDPQQRILLELCWEAIEHAGLPPSRLRGGNCGVYIGLASTDYGYRYTDDLGAIDSATIMGSTASIAANRLSYFFDFCGPSMVIDTACSSALVALHQACRAVAAGEVSHAIAGGISLHAHPFGFIAFSKASMLSPQGRCRAFDASGDGYVRSEGGGLFLLKGYEQALADGDRILAVISGSVVNTDGHKNGLTVPSVDAQTKLLQQAYTQADIDPEAIDYLEAHGTGTPVGDPIEARAIGAALGSRRRRPLPIGSVKNNMGHLEAASGVAGLVKALHILQHRVIPATIGIQTINPGIDTKKENIEVVAENRVLPATHPLTIGVNSFGFGGVNAHIIVQSPPESFAPQSRPVSSRVPLFVSGKTPEARHAAAAALANVLNGTEDEGQIYDIAYQTAFRREWHAHRALLFASDARQAASALMQYAQGTESAGCVSALTATEAPQGPVFVYSGNGSQWAGMGAGMFEDPVFAQAVVEVDALFAPLAGYRLSDELIRTGPSDQYARTELAQPALFALQVGVTRMLAERGIFPAAVMAHSVGEIAAAWACGALTLPQAVRVIYHRSRLQGRTRGQGCMSAVGMDGHAAAALIQELGLEQCVYVAGFNSPAGATLAGDPDSLTQIESTLAKRRVFQRRLDLEYAFHSPAMDAIQPELLEVLADMTPAATRIPFYSAVTGGLIAGESLDAMYWWKNIRDPVRFEQAAAQAIEQKQTVFVEVGPHPVLRGYLRACLSAAERKGHVLLTLAKGKTYPDRINDTAAQIMLSGVQCDWARWFPVAGRYVDLPAYPWQRERHWLSTTAESLGLLEARRVHPLLGYASAQQSCCWDNQLDVFLFPALGDHVVGEATLFPGSGFAEMAIAAAFQCWPGQWAEVESLEIRTPLLLEQSSTKRVKLWMDESDGSFHIHSKPLGNDAPWMHHASGRLLGEASGVLLCDAAPIVPERPPDFDADSHYHLTRALGLDYGDTFRAIRQGWFQGERQVLALLSPSDSLVSDLPAYHLHPALLDSAFQLVVQLLKNDSSLNKGMAFIPVRIGRLSLCAGVGVPALVQARLTGRSPHSLTVDFALFDADGVQLAVLHEVRFRCVRLSSAGDESPDFLRDTAIPRPLPATAVMQRAAIEADVVRDAHAAALAAPDSLHSQRRYAEYTEPLLEALCNRFLADALASLRGEGTTDLSHEFVYSLQQNSPQMALWLEALIAQATQAGLLVPDGSSGWRYCAPDNEAAAIDIWNSLVRENPDDFALTQAAGQVGLHLVEILRGSLSAESVLPRDLTYAALLQNIVGPVTRDALTRTLQAELRNALTLRDPGARLGILEIGAHYPWWGDACCAVLDFGTADYTYASSDAIALERATELLERWPDARLQTIHALKAEEALPQPVDLVIVHLEFVSIHDAGQAMAYARKCLKPSGMLLLSGVHPARWLDLVFGMQAHWWQRAEDGTLNSRQYPASYWLARLTADGWCHAALLEGMPGTDSGVFLLTAQAPEQAVAQVPAVLDPQKWLLLADSDGSSAAFAGQLMDALLAVGQQAVVHTCLSSESPDLLPDGGAGGWQHIVHLAGLSDASGSEADIERSVRRCALAAVCAQFCEQVGSGTTLWLLTAGAMQHLLASDALRDATPAAINDAALWGYGRTLANESSGFQVRLLDLPLHGAPVSSVIREWLAPDAEREILLDADGGRYALRLRPLSSVSPQAGGEPPAAIRLGFDLPGQLRNLRWMSGDESPRALDRHAIEVQVEATGLNFRDVMYALGFLSDEAIENGFSGPTLGLEFSGTVLRAGADIADFKPGDAVVGFGPASFGNRVVTSPDAIARIPDGLSFEAAATIPSVFFTVYYALHHLARLQKGERILIHGAAGGVGIAAIQHAQSCGAEIYATAGSSEKRDFLHLLGVQHVFDSRSLGFADEIMACTDGHGVDVVLNSLAGEAINRNLRILKPFGRFLELGKRDFYENTRIGLRPFRNNISYFGIDADQLMRVQPGLTRQLFGEVMALFRQGVLHPLPYRAFDANEIVDAFRYMQQARQIGKIVVTYRNGIRGAQAAGAPPSPPPLCLPADASYLVTGGLRGFGLRTAEWLVEKGARHLILISRNGLSTDAARQAVAALRARGVTVHAAACDVTDAQALQALLAETASALPPLRGIVHAAMVIDDGLIRNTDAAQIARVLAPKMLGANHLHMLTRDLALNFFVLFSSATTLFGNPGQANYVAANLWLEALAAMRRAQGLPATCVAWGAIDDVGYLASNERIKNALQGRMGGRALQSAEALQVLEQMLQADVSGFAVQKLDWRTISRFLPTADTPRFEWLAHRAAETGGDDANPDDIARLLETLDDAALHSVFVDILRSEIGDILRIASNRIDADSSVYDMGMDSLMGVELVTALEKRFGVRLPVMALSESPTLSRLATRLIEQLRASGEAASQDNVATRLGQLASQHAGRADAQDIAEVLEALASNEKHGTDRLIQ